VIYCPKIIEHSQRKTPLIRLNTTNSPPLIGLQDWNPDGHRPPPEKRGFRRAYEGYECTLGVEKGQGGKLDTRYRLLLHSHCYNNQRDRKRSKKGRGEHWIQGIDTYRYLIVVYNYI
jgi:hypothetical protein